MFFFLALRRAELDLQHPQGSHCRGASQHSIPAQNLREVGILADFMPDLPLTAAPSKAKLCTTRLAQTLQPGLFITAQSHPNSGTGKGENAASLQQQHSWSSPVPFSSKAKLIFQQFSLFLPPLKFPQWFPYITSCSLQFRPGSLPFQLPWAWFGLRVLPWDRICALQQNRGAALPGKMGKWQIQSQEILSLYFEHEHHLGTRF